MLKNHGTNRRSFVGKLAAVCVAAIGIVALVGCGGGGSNTYSPLLAAAGGATPDFTVTLGDQQLASVHKSKSTSVSQGVTAHFTVTVTSLNGFSSPVTLSLSGLPSGATAVFGQSTVTPSASGVTTTVDVSTGTPLGEGAPRPGSYTITATGSGGGVTRTGTDTLIITGAQDFSVSVGPLPIGSVTVSQGQTANYTVTLTSINGYATSDTLSFQNLPDGAVAAISSTQLTPGAGGNTRSFTISTQGGVVPGSYQFQVSATDGVITHFSNGTLVVNGQVQ